MSDYGGEVEQAVKITAQQDFCRSCGVVARPHGQRPGWVHDLPSWDGPVVVVEEVAVTLCRAGLPGTDVDGAQ